MEGHRSYPQESEPRWYGGDQSYPAEPEWDPRHGDQGYPVPASRQPSTGALGPVGPRSGRPLPPLPPLPPREPDPLRDPLPTGDTFGGGSGAGPLDPVGPGPGPVGDPPRFHTESIERSALRRSSAPAPVGDGLYRTRRPAVAVPLAIVALLLALPAGRLLLSSAFGPVTVPSGVVASTLLLIALPLLAAGLYALVTGAARVPDGQGIRAWLRPPLAYLAVGLVCCLAAALAVG